MAHQISLICSLFRTFGTWCDGGTRNNLMVFLSHNLKVYPRRRKGRMIKRHRNGKDPLSPSPWTHCLSHHISAINPHPTSRSRISHSSVVHITRHTASVANNGTNLVENLPKLLPIGARFPTASPGRHTFSEGQRLCCTR